MDLKVSGGEISLEYSQGQKRFGNFIPLDKALKILRELGVTNCIFSPCEHREPSCLLCRELSEGPERTSLPMGVVLMSSDH